MARSANGGFEARRRDALLKGSEKRTPEPSADRSVADTGAAIGAQHGFGLRAKNLCARRLTRCMFEPHARGIVGDGAWVARPTSFAKLQWWEEVIFFSESFLWVVYGDA